MNWNHPPNYVEARKRKRLRFTNDGIEIDVSDLPRNPDGSIPLSRAFLAETSAALDAIVTKRQPHAAHTPARARQRKRATRHAARKGKPA